MNFNKIGILHFRTGIAIVKCTDILTNYTIPYIIVDTENIFKDTTRGKYSFKSYMKYGNSLNLDTHKNDIILDYSDELLDDLLRSY